jgi:hypothetical protein
VSIPVPLERLRAALAERGDCGYLLTVSDDARPHAVHVALRWAGDVLAMVVGKRSAANAAARPGVSLLCAKREAGDYSLIIDGTAAVASAGTAAIASADTAAVASAGTAAIAAENAATLLVTPTKAVLHRPAAASEPASACGADCVPLVGEPDRTRR